MSARPLVLLALLVVAGALAVVQRRGASTPYSEAALANLLSQPVRRPPSPAETPRPFLPELLAPPFAESTQGGLRLDLGRVWAAPTVAGLAAERAGELLALEAEGPEGPTGLPLWRVILDGPSTAAGEPRTLALYGCRHSTDADAGPAIEDTYYARLSLARALEEHARAAGTPVTLRGTQAPERGGVNFEVQLVGEEHSIRVTFDGHPGRAYRARRAFRPLAAHEEEARASLVAALRRLAADDPRFAGLSIAGEEGPVAGGVDLRVEVVDGRLALTASRAESRLRCCVGLASEHEQESERAREDLAPGPIPRD